MLFTAANCCSRTATINHFSNGANNPSLTSSSFLRHHHLPTLHAFLRHHHLPTLHDFPTSVSWNSPASPIIFRPKTLFLVPIASPAPKITTTTSSFPTPSCTTHNNKDTARAEAQNRGPKASKSHLFFSKQIGFGLLIVMTMFVDKYIAGTFFASILGFLIVFILRLWIGKLFKQKLQADRPGSDIRSNHMAVDECRSGHHSDTDVIIVGAGVVGAALSYTLGKDGRRVQVIERELREPDRIVGELLQPGGYLKLIELGLEDCVVNIDAQRVLGYALFKDGRSTRVSYPLKNFHSDVAGRSFHNGRFIQKMREKAASLPNIHLEQGTVTSLLEDNGTVKGVEYKTKSGKQLKAYAPLTIVCDGCFSNLRRSLCSPKVENPSCFVGLILENCRLPFPNHGHVILADPSPILFYPISSTEIRCLVDIPGQKLPSIADGEMANYLKTVVAPQIPPELYDAFISAVDKGDIRTMPNRSMPAAPHPTPGALLLGDAFNMRHPLTGGGMTVALSDIVVLRDLLKPLPNMNDAESLCKYLESFYTLRKPVASTINTLAGALYKVFCASSDQARKEMREACFDYLSLGGVCSNGPIALLSGLNPQPLSLVLHFFAVAIYGVGRLLIPFPSPEKLWIGARLISLCNQILLVNWKHCTLND